MATKSEKSKKLEFEDKSDINILLLGETGVGKSTLINAVANYIKYSTFDEAKKEKLIVPIPFQSTVDTKNGTKSVTAVNSSDEYPNDGERAFQNIRTFIFPIQNTDTKIRLIDTPSITTKHDRLQNDIVCENIFNYVSNLHELHAICFVFKPSTDSASDDYDYFISYVISRFGKPIIGNIVFICTHIRTNRSEGTLKELQKSFENIRLEGGLKTSTDKTIFCFDNEAIFYLAARKKGIDDMILKEHEANVSWKKSQQQLLRLIRYIKGDDENKPLKAHFVKNQSTVNEIRRVITVLSQPLADITQLIGYNINLLNKHQVNLENKLKTTNTEQLRENLHIPVCELEVIKIIHPYTVCISCANIIKTESINDWNFKDICHDCCYLANNDENTTIQSGLKQCTVMIDSKTCVKCLCDYSSHRHVYYLTKIKLDRVQDANLTENPGDNVDIHLENIKKLLDDVQLKKIQLAEELTRILGNCVLFINFIQQTTIAPFNDSYKAHLNFLISRESALDDSLRNSETVFYLQELLKMYEDKFRERNMSKADIDIDMKEIHQQINLLYSMKHNGEKLKELVKSQKKSRSKEYENTEYEFGKSKEQSVKTEKESELKPKDNTKKSDNVTQSKENLNSPQLLSQQNNKPKKSSSKEQQTKSEFEKKQKMGPKKTDEQLTKTEIEKEPKMKPKKSDDVSQSNENLNSSQSRSQQNTETKKASNNKASVDTSQKKDQPKKKNPNKQEPKKQERAKTSKSKKNDIPPNDRQNPNDKDNFSYQDDSSYAYSNTPCTDPMCNQCYAGSSYYYDNQPPTSYPNTHPYYTDASSHPHAYDYPPFPPRPHSYSHHSYNVPPYPPNPPFHPPNPPFHPPNPPNYPPNSPNYPPQPPNYPYNRPTYPPNPNNYPPNPPNYSPNPPNYSPYSSEYPSDHSASQNETTGKNYGKKASRHKTKKNAQEKETKPSHSKSGKDSKTPNRNRKRKDLNSEIESEESDTSNSSN